MSTGAGDELKGRIEEAVGSLTDDEKLKKEGRADKKAGESKRKANEALEEKEEADR